MTDGEPRAERLDRVVFMSGSMRGRKVTLREGMTFGRSQEAEVVVQDQKVSRLHARVARQADGVLVIEDLDSRNGTYVNGKRVTQRALAHGDRIQLGTGLELSYQVIDGAEAEVLRRRRLEALGRVSMGIAHDLNNMHGVIVSTLDALTHALSSAAALHDPVVAECMSDIHTATERSTELAGYLLAAARGEDQPHTEVDLTRLCNEIGRLLVRNFGRALVVKLDVAPELRVQGNRAELQQVLLNLCTNARDAMPEGGELTLSAQLQPGNAESDPGVHVSVADTGVGIAEEAMGRVFDRFYTTKREGVGYGVGLSTVHDIVSFHGGTIDVKSTVGSGTVFTVTLPASPSAGRRLPPPTIAQRPPRGEGRVLVVDDEDLVARSIARSLSAAGFDVLTASSGDDALARYASARPKPDLVLLDVSMPGGSGEEVGTMLHELDPQVRVLLMSGNDAASVDQAGDHVVGFLRKPFSAALLVETISTTLIELVDEEFSDTTQERIVAGFDGER